MAKVPEKLAEVALPTDEEILSAKEMSRLFSTILEQDSELRLKLPNTKKKDQEVLLPVTAARLLIKILEEMGRGRSVEVFSTDAELTTQQAAHALNVSRPFVVKLVDDGKLPCKKVGRHRRIRFDDLLRYKQLMETDRKSALDELAAQAQDQDMGY
jgi:excisionase family DNA binding protein